VPHLTWLISDLASRRALRSSACGQLLVPQARCALKLRRTFSVIGPSTWNELHSMLRLLPLNEWTIVYLFQKRSWSFILETSGDLYSASSRDYYSEAIIMTDCPKSLLPLATSRQEVFLNCMNVKHFCSSQEEVDARLFLSYTAWILYEKVLQSCTFRHIFHHRWRKQEARNITGTGGTGTGYHKNCSIARLSVWPCRKTMLPIFSKVYCTFREVVLLCRC